MFLAADVSGGFHKAASCFDSEADALRVLDPDMGAARAFTKTESVQQIWDRREIAFRPGRYLRVSARVKVGHGPLPFVRLAGRPIGADGSDVAGLKRFSDMVKVARCGEVVEVAIIVGSGARDGVDWVWGIEPVLCQFALEIRGPNGAALRVSPLEIEDVSARFAQGRDWCVDVRDFGALGDGRTDDAPAFVAANAAAAGRTVLVPRGVFRLSSDVSIDAPLRCVGRLSMPDDAALVLRRDFDLTTYIDAFGDEEVALKKVLQALLISPHHTALDLCGRKVRVTAPIDVQAAVGRRSSYASRKTIQNGALEAAPSAAWQHGSVTVEATARSGDPRRLTEVVGAASIAVGAVVTGDGVAPGTVVQAVRASRQEVTLNRPLEGGWGKRVFELQGLKYLLDFSGFRALSRFDIVDVDLLCHGRCGAVLEPANGEGCVIRGGEICNAAGASDAAVRTPATAQA